MPDAVSELVIASTGKQACAITQARQVYCWGDIVHDDVAQPQRVFPPRLVEGVTNVRQIAMTAGSVCALEGDGSVGCFGLLMGINVQPAFMTPVQVEVPPATAIAADFIQTCVIGQDGARCWGGHSAQRGKQMSLDSITLIFGTEGATALRAEDGEMCVIYPDGLEECWSTTRVPRESRAPDRR